MTLINDNQSSQFYHGHKIINGLCEGRLKCVRACPTKAIRVHSNNVAFFSDLCIDCGECIIVCPENVFVPLTDSLDDFKSFKYHMVMPSNILYTQFGTTVHPLVVHKSLKKLGFDDIVEVAGLCDEVGYALHHHMKHHPDIRPIISSFCPAIVRFIQVSYPNLVKNLDPLDVPREIAAREAKKLYSKKLGLKMEEIGLTYITPCTAKMVSIKQPAEKTRSWIDGTIPIRDIYNLLLPEILRIQSEPNGGILKDDVFHYGKAWGILGHYSQHVGAERSISVSGINHVKQILDELEKNSLHNIDFIEALSCKHGCTNGVFCVKDPFLARHNSIQLHTTYGRSTTNLDTKKILDNYEKKFFFHESPVLPRTTRAQQQDIGERIKWMKMKERIYAKLPKKDCSLCGAPDCETFADDCARHEADITECIFFKKWAESPKDNKDTI